MEIYIEKISKKVILNIEKDILVKDILKKLDISPSSCIIVKNGKVIIESSKVSQKDKIQLLSVVSGG